MKALLALLLCAAACFADVAPPERREPGSRPALRHATVTLVDGSVLHGDLRPRFLPAFSPNLGRIRVDLAKVERIEFETAPGQRDSEAGIRVSPREPGFGFRETRRETRAAPGAASETRRETRLPNPESRPSGGCAAGPCGRGGAAPWVPMQGRIAFRNGDRLTVRFPDNLRFLPFDTLLGRVRLPLRAVSSLAIASDETDALLYHCTFDSASSIAHPAAGPAGTFLGGEFVPGKVGSALRVRKGLSSAIVPFEKGTFGPRGTIEFWAKIENDRETYGDGGDPRFFMMETKPGSETVFQFAANDGCGRGGLSIYHQGISVASAEQCQYPARYDAVLSGDRNGWHHYALVWDESGVPGTSGPNAVAVFLDGRRVPLHGDLGLAKAARMASRFRENPATLFLPLDPERGHDYNNKTDFLIDELKIWAEAKPPFEPR